MPDLTRDPGGSPPAKIRVDHPMLRADPARAAAFADLELNPVGNYREWARRWNWTLARVQRFIIALEREGLISCRRSRWGTMVTPIRRRYGADTEVDGPPDTDPERKQYGADSEPILLGSTTRLKQSLGLGGSGLDEKSPTDNYTAACIETMNEQLSRMFPGEYRPVMFNNDASGKTVDRWKAAGVELEFAIEKIREGCFKFNPSKHGGGNLPGTLAYFQKGVLEAHTTRAQLTIGPLPVVQRGGADKRRQRRIDESDKPSAAAPVSAMIEEAVPVGSGSPKFREAFHQGRQAGAGGRLR
jgi:hypothetical protein